MEKGTRTLVYGAVGVGALVLAWPVLGPLLARARSGPGSGSGGVPLASPVYLGVSSSGDGGLSSSAPGPTGSSNVAPNSTPINPSEGVYTGIPWYSQPNATQPPSSAPAYSYYYQNPATGQQIVSITPIAPPTGFLATSTPWATNVSGVTSTTLAPGETEYSFQGTPSTTGAYPGGLPATQSPPAAGGTPTYNPALPVGPNNVPVFYQDPGYPAGVSPAGWNPFLPNGGQPTK